MDITKALFKIEFKKLLKTPIILIFGMIAPIFFLVMQASMFNSNIAFGEKSVSMLDMSLPMCALMSIAVLGVGNVGVGISFTRTVGFLKRLRVTPAKKSHYITANFLVQVIGMLLTVATLFIVAALGYSVDLSSHNIPLFLLLVALNFLMCYFIGMFIGSVCEDPRVSQSVSMGVYFLFIFLGGFTFPIEMMPELIQKLTIIIPTTHAVKIMQYAWNEVNIFTDYHFIYVLVTTLIFGILTFKFFRYE